MTVAPIDLVLSRLHGVTRKNHAILARCPAHADKGPSLSVRAAADGQVLINCFAGCSFPAIVDAMGLRQSDFFPPKDKAAEERLMLQRSALRRRYRAASPRAQEAMIAEQMTAAETRVRERYADELGEIAPMRSKHVNEARSEVSDALGISLEPVDPFAWEMPPHDADPAWPFLFERAMRQAEREADGLLVSAESIRFRAATLAAAELHREVQLATG